MRQVVYQKKEVKGIVGPTRETSKTLFLRCMLKHRSSVKEDMDNLELSGDELKETLDGLSTVNRLFGNTSITLAAVKKQLAFCDERPIRIIDLGCGGGDNLRSIARWCQQSHIEVELLGIDGNPNILQYARQKNSRASTIEYLQADLLDSKFEVPKCDILLSSHFLYRFSDSELTSFYIKAQGKVSVAIVSTDLQRHVIPYFLFKILGQFMPFSTMVKQDGLKAISRSFTRSELQSILDQAQFKSYRLKWKWAFRFLVVAKPS